MAISHNIKTTGPIMLLLSKDALTCQDLEGGSVVPGAATLADYGSCDVGRLLSQFYHIP